MTPIFKYELLRTGFITSNPNATELELIGACIEFARSCNLYRVEAELLRQHDCLADEITRRELVTIKK